jgi:hypothetical protein
MHEFRPLSPTLVGEDPPGGSGNLLVDQRRMPNTSAAPNAGSIPSATLVLDKDAFMRSTWLVLATFYEKTLRHRCRWVSKKSELGATCSLFVE